MESTNFFIKIKPQEKRILKAYSEKDCEEQLKQSIKQVKLDFQKKVQEKISTSSIDLNSLSFKDINTYQIEEMKNIDNLISELQSVKVNRQRSNKKLTLHKSQNFSMMSLSKNHLAKPSFNAEQIPRSLTSKSSKSIDLFTNQSKIRQSYKKSILEKRTKRISQQIYEPKQKASLVSQSSIYSKINSNKPMKLKKSLSKKVEQRNTKKSSMDKLLMIVNKHIKNCPQLRKDILNEGLDFLFNS